MAKKKYCYDYPRPAVSVDVVLVTREAKPRVLLIRRAKDPFQGCWAIPGGFVEMDEGLEEAARRELYEETNLRIGSMEQLYTFGDPRRDPRQRTITVAYLAQVHPKDVTPQAGDDAAATGWHSLRRPPKLAFDHAEILALARARLTALNP